MVTHMHRVHKKFRKNINKVSKKCMDTKRRKVKNIDNVMHQKSLNILTLNAAGLKHKKEDLINKVMHFKSSIFSVQETHFVKKGRFKLEKYIIFEAIRKSKERGGSMLGVHVDLQPVLVKEYSDEFELIVVEVITGNTKIRIMTGYGPQESWEEAKRIVFFEALETEVASAELDGRSVIISMDANSKLGPMYVVKDPHEQSKNGKILADILDRHALVVVNGLQDKCVGVITRQRCTESGIEKSVIDFVVVSSDLVKHIDYMHVDDARENVLTKLLKSKRGKTTKVESDHNLIETKINVPWNMKVDEPTEVFNFKDKAGQEKFFEVTSNTKDLTKIFDINKSLQV